jgi:hypothetical protein
MILDTTIKVPTIKVPTIKAIKVPEGLKIRQ